MKAKKNIKKIEGVKFDLDYCKTFSAAKLKKIYSHVSDKAINALIKEIGAK